MFSFFQLSDVKNYMRLLHDYKTFKFMTRVTITVGDETLKTILLTFFIVILSRNNISFQTASFSPFFYKINNHDN